jgi:hypothetical protein
MLDVAGNDDPEMLVGMITPDVRWEIANSVPRPGSAAIQ